MKMILFAALVSASAHAEGFRLPFRGRWFVMQGGDTENVNQHMTVRAQWFGLDFMKVGGTSQRELTRVENPTDLTDYYSWGEPVVSPVDGKVEAAVDGFPDNPLGKSDPKNPAGNHVVIGIPGKRYVFLAHLQKGTVKVKPGRIVSKGDLLGLCGNSGNSGGPHVHLHVQDAPKLNEGEGQNMIFRGLNVELSGKTFEGVEWPLIRGLFVWD